MKANRPKQIAYDVQVALEPWAELRNTKSQHPRATKRASQIPPNPKPPSTRHPSPRSEVTTHCGTTGRPWRRCDHQRRSIPRSRSWKRDERASQPRPQRSAGTPAPGSTRRGPPRRTAGPRCECFPAGSKNPAQVVGFQAIETEIVKSQGLIALIGRDLMANGVLIVNGPEGTMTLALP